MRRVMIQFCWFHLSYSAFSLSLSVYHFWLFQAPTLCVLSHFLALTSLASYNPMLILNARRLPLLPSPDHHHHRQYWHETMYTLCITSSVLQGRNLCTALVSMSIVSGSWTMCLSTFDRWAGEWVFVVLSSLHSIFFRDKIPTIHDELAFFGTRNSLTSPFNLASHAISSSWYKQGNETKRMNAMKFLPGAFEHGLANAILIHAKKTTQCKAMEE